MHTNQSGRFYFFYFIFILIYKIIIFWNNFKETWSLSELSEKLSHDPSYLEFSQALLSQLKKSIEECQIKLQQNQTSLSEFLKRQTSSLSIDNHSFNLTNSTLESSHLSGSLCFGEDVEKEDLERLIQVYKEGNKEHCCSSMQVR